MTLVERTGIADHAPEALWDRIARMDWQAWDPDVAAMENVEGGLIEGGTFLYVLNNGLRLPSRISDVSCPTGFTWSGVGYGGLLGFWGRLDFAETESGTKITYGFQMTRPVGWIAHWRLKDQVIHGVEEGLAGIIRETGIA